MRPFAPSHHFALELTSSERCDHEPALAIRGICPGVAITAESDEAVEVEVGAAPSTLEDVMHLQPGPQAASLADPASAGQDLRANVLVLLQACGGAS